MTTPTIESFAANMVKALRQIAVLAEYQTTGPGKCESYALTAKQATALRLAISDIARAALELAEVAPQAIAAGQSDAAAAAIAKIRGSAE